MKRNNSNKVKKDKSFLLRLFDILNDTANNNIIHWNLQGNGIIILDIEKFSNIVLPRFFIHKNYATFIRQLNIYGFSKNKNKLVEGEGYSHEIFNKNISKEEIKKIKRKKKINKYLINYNKDNLKINLAGNNHENNEKDIINVLLLKNKENSEVLEKLKKEYEDIKFINQTSKEKICKIQNEFNEHNIIIEKIIKKENDINCLENKKDNNLKDLFRNYLYYRKISSPYIIY